MTRGCDPSKTLVHRANVVEGVRRAEQFGIEAEVTDIDFSRIVAESTEPFDEKAEHMEDHVRDAENVTFYGAEAAFVDERTLSVGDEEITAVNVVIAAGSRPVIPSGRGRNGFGDRRRDPRPPGIERGGPAGLRRRLILERTHPLRTEARIEYGTLVRYGDVEFEGTARTVR